VEVHTVLRTRLGVAAALSIIVGSVVVAQDKQKFELKLEKDKPFYQKLSTTVEQIIMVQGTNLNQKQESTFYFKWTPTGLAADKWTLKQRIEGLRMSIDISGNPITYETGKSSPGSAGNPGLMDFFKNLEGAEFTVTLNTKDWKVEKVEGKDDFVKKLGAGSAQMDGLLKKIMTDDAVKQMADPTYGLIPDQPKAVNEVWEKKVTVGLGPIGSYDVTYKCTYKGKDTTQKTLDRIEVDTSLTYKPPTDSADGLLFKIKSGSMTSKPLTPLQAPSVILYNPERGRIEKATISLHLTGEMMVTIGGTDSKVELTQSQTTTIETSDTPQLTDAQPKTPEKK
jgi:hypothetical protein